MSRLALLLEIAGAYALIEASLWTEMPWRQLWWYVGAAWILVFAFLRRRELRPLGLGARGLLPSAWVAAAGVGLAALLLLGGWFAGTLHDIYVAHPVRSIAAYTLWALGQQFIAQSFFFVRLEKLLGSGRRAVWTAALLFAAAHLPNPVLMAVTLPAGLAFAAAFRRYRSIYPLAVAHALLGLALAVSVPNSVHRNMRVGIGYLDWHSRPTVVP